MIRPLVENDLTSVRRFLEPVQPGNIYIYSTLLHAGLSQPGLQFWGDFDEMHRLSAVLSRFGACWMLWHAGFADWTGLARTVLADGRPFYFSGEATVLAPLQEILVGARTHDHEQMALCALEEAPPPLKVGEVRRANAGDLGALARFFAGAGEMRRSSVDLADTLCLRRVYAVWRHGHVVSAAVTNAEAPRIAVIGGVYTAPAYRRKGLSTACVGALAGELLAEGRTPWLYYRNESAGRVYRHLGFRMRGEWARWYYDAGSRECGGGD